LKQGTLARAFIAGVFISITCVMVTLAGALPAHAEDAPSDDCQASAAGEAYRNLPAPYAPGPSTAIVHVRVGGQNFYVPQNYFRHPAIGCGAEEQGFLLRVLLPDMEGYTAANADEIEGVDKPGWGRRMNILVQALEGARDYMRFVFHPFSGGVDPNGTYPTQYGLLHARSNRVRSGPPHTEIDVFFPEGVETARHFIVCAAVEAVPSPGCAHHFFYLGLQTKVTYGRDHLPQWREIETKVRSLLDQFGSQPRKEE
jgi:hypothetical protein